VDGRFGRSFVIDTSAAQKWFQGNAKIFETLIPGWK